MAPPYLALFASKSELSGPYSVVLQARSSQNNQEIQKSLHEMPAISESEVLGEKAPTSDASNNVDQCPTTIRTTPPHIEGYEILGRLGKGGMGTVWRVIQLSTKREVALKLLGGKRLTSDRARVRFEREVTLSAQLTHPNIARVYDSGLLRGQYYYVLELVEGVHLDDMWMCGTSCNLRIAGTHEPGWAIGMQNLTWQDPTSAMRMITSMFGT